MSDLIVIYEDVTTNIISYKSNLRWWPVTYYHYYANCTEAIAGGTLM